MAKKRKADATRLDEADRNLYANFRGAANALSQLYSQTINQQRLSFHSGERHAMEKLYQWILRQQEEGSRVTTDDIIAYLQDEIEYGTDDAIPTFPSPFGNHHSETVTQPSQMDTPISCNIPPPANVGFDQQAKNSMFPNALSSPVRLSLQQYHLTDHSDYYSDVHSPDNRLSVNLTNNQSQRQSRPNPPHIPEDYADMQTDIPGQKSA
uniref:Holocarboxylase synthetase n=1 Tax=Kalanchoe fedtschenkoi TaxID=63787 RepID=A0A7N1A683_KALFE